MPRAVGLADELLTGWAPVIADIELITGSKGVFDVELDGELLFSKKAKGRHADPGEVVALVRDRIGPELHWS